MKCFVLKKDEEIVYLWPSKKYQDDLDNFKIPDQYLEHDFVIIDQEDLPKEENGFLHEQLYFDGDLTKENLKVDSAWEKKIMPDFLIKQKHLAKLQADLDAKLEKETPDAIEAMKLQSAIKKKESINAGPQNENETWLNVALDGLDKRVAGGESDKPEIRTKIQAKIAELKAQNGGAE